MLFGCALFSCVLTANAMKNNSNDPLQNVESKHSPQKVEAPLKFKVDPKTGKVEDSDKGSYLYEFQSLIRDLHEGYGALRDDAQRKLNKIEETLKTPEQFEEHYTSNIYKNNILQKIEQFKENVAVLIDHEILLGKTLTAIYKGNETTPPYMKGFWAGVPNYELLSKSKFITLEKLDFSFTWDERKKVGKHSILLTIDSQISTHIGEDLQDMFWRRDRIEWKLPDTQKEVWKKAKLLYHLAKGTEHELSFDERILLKVTSLMAQDAGKTTKELLKEQMDELISKAKDTYIPLLGQKYLFAKTIMAFQEEVERHRAT